MKETDIDRAIKMLSRKLDMLDLPEEVDESLTLAKDIDSLHVAKLILNLYKEDLR